MVAGVMLSTAKSRYTLLVQLLFVVVNAIGLVAGSIYNGKTPDLYENNLHHKFGWAITFIIAVQVVIGVFSRRVGSSKQDVHTAEERSAFLPVSFEAMAAHQATNPGSPAHEYRWSGDSGQGTERNSASLRGDDSPSPDYDEHDYETRYKSEAIANDNVHGRSWRALVAKSRVGAYLEKISPEKVPRRILSLLELFYGAVDCTILILGFVAIATGFVTYGGIFVSITGFYNAFVSLTLRLAWK